MLTTSSSLTATFSRATETELELPRTSSLRAVYPNPASRSATIEATLARPGALSVRVLDLLGREVRVLADGPAQAGRHELTLDTHALPSGVYVVQMRADDIRATQRFVVVR
jgi:hypothetical protein